MITIDQEPGAYEVGPTKDGNSYGYRIKYRLGWLYSAQTYANAASARWAACQPQQLDLGSTDPDGYPRIEPQSAARQHYDTSHWDIPDGNNPRTGIAYNE